MEKSIFRQAQSKYHASFCTGQPTADFSKDFDDAVYAEKTETGFKLIVAIADVAWYVREGSGLDREAYRRGNSVYLPNVVLPMLPPRLSNDLCSLNPREERAALACFMEIDRDGNLLSYDFKRAVIKSAAEAEVCRSRAVEGSVFHCKNDL